ncbi:hypothetical protein LshimejAT787_0108160 [Lyophyllum shimeji]|uniref:Uncharacterized protein n=1 Tax=Lyophyllum shimeji TaxID=47721 RepID=A0A9P3PED9_LYOSH|nr:hypothetical protein LshimejAT787_0108160 [Lyophyllum shimeji]
MASFQCPQAFYIVRSSSYRTVAQLFDVPLDTRPVSSSVFHSTAQNHVPVRPPSHVYHWRLGDFYSGRNDRTTARNLY